MANTITATPVVITPEALLKHWQGHRQLTRRMIEAFPEKELFNFSIGGMRTFAALAQEIMSITAAGIRGIITGQWPTFAEMGGEVLPANREALLHAWDKITAELNVLWPQIPGELFQQTMKSFGQLEGPVWGMIFYYIDNEIHHRGQGYVYLRALGIEPPAFWDRPQ
ncbi:DinB family protein [Chitinophaga vietnamensis]|uniref:DinB family protein n=1 Tax=Chitinophaga vietnamensis TaxID=2593957 RepID=UPI001177525D|nr:DinB family protein [Chitinophaga vietnamensis]